MKTNNRVLIIDCKAYIDARKHAIDGDWLTANRFLRKAYGY